LVGRKLEEKILCSSQVDMCQQAHRYKFKGVLTTSQLPVCYSKTAQSHGPIIDLATTIREAAKWCQQECP